MQSAPNDPNLPLPNEQNNQPEPRPGRRRVIRNTLSITFIFLSALAAWWLLTHRQDVTDFVRYRSYTPTAEVVALADKTDMTGEARYIFYVSDPKINDKEAFNRHCSFNDEAHTIVLGCYRAQNIFLYNVVDQRLSGVKEVTAAHEMLHAIYERLSTSERSVVDRLLQDELTRISNPRIREIAERYGREDASTVWNEMHSVLGTEYQPLSNSLEAHYKKYFKDRNKVVALAQGYEGVFTASKDRLKALDDQLANIKELIDANYGQLEQLKGQLDQEEARLVQLRQTDMSAYNAAIPGYYLLIQRYNALVVETRKVIAQHNTLVDERNNEAATHNDLYKNLDSHIQTIQGN